MQRRLFLYSKDPTSSLVLRTVTLHLSRPSCPPRHRADDGSCTGLDTSQGLPVSYYSIKIFYSLSKHQTIAHYILPISSKRHVEADIMKKN